MKKDLVDCLLVALEHGGWGALDPDFYKDVRSKGNVQIILYGAPWGQDELKA